MLLLILLLAHYSSQYTCYEDGAKNPLKSISVKLLVLALIAQIRVSAGNEGVGHP